MPSPAFRINGGAVGAKATVSPGATVTATLDSTDGVRSVAWSVIGTDETRTVASYTLTQSGSVGQTVSLTAGTYGTAGILRCEINGGLNLQTEQADPATRATAKWCVPTEEGLEVGCVNEGMESDPAYGWTGFINACIRVAASGLPTITGTEPVVITAPAAGVRNVAMTAASRTGGGWQSDEQFRRVADAYKFTRDDITAIVEPDDGTICYAADVDASYQFTEASGLTPDGQEILDGDGGTWRRIREQLATSSVLAERKVIALYGDSNAAGFSASQENATGFRTVLQRVLSEAGIWFRMVGIQGFGYTNGTGTTWGKNPNVEDFHDAPQFTINDWRHDGFSGRRISYASVVDNIDTDTDVISDTGHLLSDGSPVVITSTGTLPTVVGAIPSVAGTILAFARDVAAATSYKLAAYQGGPALDITAAGSGTITANEGLSEMAAAIMSSYDETPTDIILMGGTNDIANLIDTAAASPLETLQARATAYFANVETANHTARKYVASLLPFTSGIASFADKQTLRNDYNTWLATYVPTLGRNWTFVDAGAAVGAAQMTSDGVHPHSFGFTIYGEALARAIIAGSGGSVEQEKIPRPFVRRAQQACIELRATGDNVRVPNQAIITPGANSFFAAIWFMPFEFKTGTNAILQMDNPYSSGALISCTNSNLLMYWKSAGTAIPSSGYTAVLKRYRWHRLFAFFDRATSQAALFCNGRLVQRVFTTATDAAATNGWYMGGGGLNSAPGLYQGFLMGHGADLDIEDALRMAQRGYYLGEDPAGTTAKYHLDDDSGTAPTGEVAGSTNAIFTVTTGGWVASGRYPKPVDQGYVKTQFDQQVRSVTATYTATYGELVKADPSGGAFTINLPTAVGRTGQQIRVKNVTSSTNAITLDGNASETIDGATTVDMATAYQSLTLESDGANWVIV